MVRPRPGDTATRARATVAAFDIGSNTIRGILAQPRGDGVLRVLAADQRMTALGRGLSGTGRLDPDGLTATVDFAAETMDAWGCPERVFAVATEAARAARNAEELLDRLRDDAGVEAEIISGEHEARLAWLGALSADPELLEYNPAVVDIGGRSTEVVVELDGELRCASYSVGARSMTEEALNTGMRDFAEQVIAQRVLRRDVGAGIATAGRSGMVVCIGGTAQAAARLAGKRRLTAHDVAEMYTELTALSPEQCRARMDFDPERAEIIRGGLLILAGFARFAPDRALTVSEGGVREGLLLDRTGATGLEWSNECFA